MLSTDSLSNMSASGQPIYEAVCNTARTPVWYEYDKRYDESYEISKLFHVSSPWLDSNL